MAKGDGGQPGKTAGETALELTGLTFRLPGPLQSPQGAESDGLYPCQASAYVWRGHIYGDIYIGGKL